MSRNPDLASTGNEELDHVLRGGLPRNAMYLLQGVPGSGKTTLALQFLLEAARQGERTLYVTLSETRDEINRVARSHGWSLDPLGILELSAMRQLAEPTARQTLFHSAEVELHEVTSPILAEIDRLQASAVVIDSLSEIRLLSGELLRFRRQILALKQFFAERRCTVLLLDDRTGEASGAGLLESLAHGVITLEKESPRYGRTRRRLSIDKLRGVPFREGYHDVRIETGGVRVFPRLVAGEHTGRVVLEPLRSGVAGVDELLGGGPDRGTSTLFLGPSGVGKSSLTMQYCVAAAERGERAALFLFDEGLDTALARAASLGMPLKPHLDAGLIAVRVVNPAELTAGEFSHAVREAVTVGEARVVVIDSLNGFTDSVPDEQFLTLHLRELLTYLNSQGVATLTVLTQHGLMPDAARTTVDVSYLADNVVVLRYFEAQGRLRQAISVFKKRSGRHERTIREFTMSDHGLVVGAPLTEFAGVLSGMPSQVGTRGPP
ncbi:MAG TPA: ATPase domain-containing protein [Anaeromyxobacter sp.]|nr:ATPase domain-containing protein [Anaeromyxobacter sp.]